MSKSGDWNGNTPTIQGIEVHPTYERTAGPFNVTNIGVLQRFRGSAVSITQAHTYLSEVVGAPGLGVEILDTLIPARTDEIHFPGTDTGAQITGWEDQSNAAATFARVDDQFDQSDYLRNSAAKSYYTALALRFRGNDTALTGKRIDNVEIWAAVSLTPSVGTSPSVRLRGQINSATAGVISNFTGATLPADGVARQIKLASWSLDPYSPAQLTDGNLPWTLTKINARISTTATENWGLVVDRGSIAAEAFRVYGMWMVVTTMTENRKAVFYQTGTPRAGWSRNTLSGPDGGAVGALSANTYYWLHIYSLFGSSQNYFKFNHQVDPSLVIASDPTIATIEHRLASSSRLTNQGCGVIASIAESNFSGLIPFLLEFTGPTIHSQSQPYAKIGVLTFDATGAANRGTEITSASGTNSYTGVKLPITWVDPNTPPDRPLVIEIRHGIGSLTGGGTLLATATFDAHLNPSWPALNPNGADTFVAFDAGSATPPATTQLFALVKSSATAGKGWKVPRLDTRSDFIGTGAGTTVANVEGASFGGQTDSYSTGGTEQDRYDMPISLVNLPVAPANPAATIRSAT